MTGVGIYLVILYILGICANFYYAGQGGHTITPGVLIVSAFWSMVNLALIITVGTGSI